MNERQRKNKNILVTSLLTVGLGATAAHAISQDKEKTQEVVVGASVSVTAVETIGGEDSGWELGAAERAIEKGLAEANAHLSVGDLDFTGKISELPTYDEATKAVKLAHEDDGTIPGNGDKIKLTMYVVEDSNENVSYEVTDAELIDISNNQ